MLSLGLSLLLAPHPELPALARVEVRLADLATAAQQAGRGREPLRVLVELEGPRPDQERLAAARRLPRWSAEDSALRADELSRATRELEAAAATLQAPVARRVQDLGGTVRRSFWLVNVLAVDLPADQVHALAGQVGVEALHWDAPARPLQDCAHDPPFPAAVYKPTEPVFGLGTWKFGGEDQTHQGVAHARGYDGSLDGVANASPVVIAIADSGFDLDTDQYKDGPQGPCWCPADTIMQDPLCVSWSPEVHGSLTRRYVEGSIGGFSICGNESRVLYAEDTFGDQDLDADGDGDFEFDDAISPEALFWDRSDNLTHYAHGTMVSALATGNWYFDLNPLGCQHFCPGSDLVVPDPCPQVGLIGAAPGAEVQLFKIGMDAAGAVTTYAVEIAAVEGAVAEGAQVFNMSYMAYPYPNAPINQALDQAGLEHDLVVVVAAGNFGRESFPDKITVGFFNGMIIGSVGLNGLTTDVVSPGSSHGLLAWPDPNDSGADIISGRDGISAVAPGGFWDLVQPWGVDGGGPYWIVDGGDLPMPNESRTTAYQPTVGVWAIPNMVGTSLAAPQVAGGAALVLDAYESIYGAGAYLPSTAVRAILLNEATDISAVPGNEFLDGRHYGQGRLDLDRATEFVELLMTPFANLWTGVVHPDDRSDKYGFQQISSGPFEATLTWDRVVIQDQLGDDPNCSNLNLVLLDAQGAVVMRSRHKENNVERISFDGANPLPAGQYFLRVRGKTFVLDKNTIDTPDVRYALAQRGS